MAHTFKGATLQGLFYRRRRAPKLAGFNQFETKRKTGKKTELIAKNENSHDDKCDNDNEDKQINFLCSGL